jgi:membrane protein
MDPFYAGGAAEVAFFLILSFVPTTILLAQLFHLFSMSMTALTEVVSKYVENDVMKIIAPLLEYSPSHALSIVLIVLALWAGSRALFSLMRMSNYAYKGGSGYKNPVFGYIRERGRALITILLVLLTFVLTLNTLVYGEVIVKLILRYLNDFLGENYTFSDAWYTARWVIALVLYLFMVMAIYYMLPNRKSTFSKHLSESFFKTVKNVFFDWVRRSKGVFKMILPGSIFASIGMLIATWLYSFYIKYVAMKSNFDILYGGLSTVALLLLWFYVLAYILIIGIQLNAAWAELRKRKGEGNER